MAVIGPGNRVHEQVITGPEQVTADWLTAVLRRSGALAGGAVTGLEVNWGRGNWSAGARLTATYAAGSTGELPEKLFLKLVSTDQDDESFGPSEVYYYARDYVDVEGAPLVRCYDAAYAGELGRYHLLLQDLTDSHVQASEKTPTLEYGLALAEGLAALHARWWGAEGLAAAGAPIHDAGHIGRFVALSELGAGHIINGFANDLEPQWPNLIRELYAGHPQVLTGRTQEANGFSLIHGDANETNILVPRDGDRPLYLIDRQPFDWSLTTWLGVFDLAYAMVLNWYVNTRRQFELPVLHHYHEELVRRGIEDYSWERLYDDYRLAVAMGVFVACEYCRGGINSRLVWLWLPMLQRALTACDDLDVRALW
jgi:hypothetical protein